MTHIVAQPEQCLFHRLPAAQEHRGIGRPHLQVRAGVDGKGTRQLDLQAACQQLRQLDGKLKACLDVARCI